MEPSVANPACDPAAESTTTDQESVGPGLQGGLLLVGDSIMTILRLLKTETAMALSLLPTLLVMNVVRLPMALLTWLSFALLVAWVVFSLTGIALAGVATFFAVQLAATLMLERSVKIISRKCSLPESRKSVAMLISAIHDSITHEQKDEDSAP